MQLNGRTCDMDVIAARHGLSVVEDAAQALGSKFRGRFAGTFGRAGVFSFFPSKVLGCLGDGGAVVTNDDDLAARVRLMRDHGRNERGEVELWGSTRGSTTFRPRFWSTNSRSTSRSSLGGARSPASTRNSFATFGR